MYDILTTYYAALFKVQLPLYMDWRMDANFDLLGQSESLRESFYELRDEVELFCMLRIPWHLYTEDADILHRRFK
jgi:hypothetical protein